MMGDKQRASKSGLSPTNFKSSASFTLPERAGKQIPMRISSFLSSPHSIDYLLACGAVHAQRHQSNFATTADPSSP